MQIMDDFDFNDDYIISNRYDESNSFETGSKFLLVAMPLTILLGGLYNFYINKTIFENDLLFRSDEIMCYAPNYYFKKNALSINYDSLAVELKTMVNF